MQLTVLFKHCSFPRAILYDDMDKKAQITMHQTLSDPAMDAASDALSCTDILLLKGIFTIFGCDWHTEMKA